MTADSPPPLAWSQALGGLLSAQEAAARLGVDVPMVVDAGERGEMILLEDQAGGRVLPGFQFKHGWPPPALITAWRTLTMSVEPWTAAAWAASPDPRLGDRAPIDCASGDGAARVLRLAEHDAARLAA